ncbi:peroxidase 57-like [Humulus lupulus]|uniref:peroxidase 57-like n=1 Tax=Humulus lupulus TaxID=3486 RepID=UPI002B40C155|nr:peroxidase 57-like [Humulus lupulus]
MTKKMNNNISSLVILLSFLTLSTCVFAQLTPNFYRVSCPNAEQIIKQVVKERFAKDSSIAAALLRMHFHDCFVKGCDASILINSTSTKPSEKTAAPNLTVRGYEIIDEAKRRLEAACPSKVSCADIITVATRDSVFLAGGPNYAVSTGRRDGLVSNPNNVNLPGPSQSVTSAFQSFQAKNMTLNEMVVLLGAHTVGFAHCNFFSNRLSNFQGTGKPDPSMDPKLVTKLKSVCANGNNPKTFLDQNTSNVFDNEFYRQIRLKRGVLQIDQELASDSTTSGFVANLASNLAQFSRSFVNAITKMGKIEVLVGNAGEIRKNCAAFNPPKSKIGSSSGNNGTKKSKKPLPKTTSKKSKTTPSSSKRKSPKIIGSLKTRIPCTSKNCS